MSDRAPVNVRLAAVPAEHREAIAGIFDEHGIESSDGATVSGGSSGWSPSEIHAGLGYMADDVRLGTDDEIAESLSHLSGVIARVSQEAKYEYDATTVYVVDGVLWGGTARQDGELVVPASSIDRVVTEVRARYDDCASDGYDEILARLRRLTGSSERGAFDEAWEAATNPMWRIVGPVDPTRVQLTMTFHPMQSVDGELVEVEPDDYTRARSWTEVVPADEIPGLEVLRERRSPWWVKSWTGPWELDVVATPHRLMWSVYNRAFSDQWPSTFTSSEKAEYPLPEGGAWMRTTFWTPFEQHADRVGEAFWVVREITEPDDSHDAEVLPMYEIRFVDGTRIEAFRAELFDDAPQPATVS